MFIQAVCFGVALLIHTRRCCCSLASAKFIKIVTDARRATRRYYYYAVDTEQFPSFFRLPNFPIVSLLLSPYFSSDIFIRAFNEFFQLNKSYLFFFFENEQVRSRFPGVRDIRRSN